MNLATCAARGALRHGAIIAGFSFLVAIGLGIARGGDWDVQIVYAEAIGLCIWACNEFGRYLFRIDPETNWPSGWRSVVLQVSSVVIGYTVGTGIGDLYCGSSTFALWRDSPRSFASYLVLCIAISASVSYFFMSRSKDQRRQREIAMVQRDAAEARLKLLESQLEPHMLFNTLANLRALIGVDPPRAQAMLDQLIAFLRATLGASRVPFHALEAEFERVADYLALMQVRMGPRLATRLDVAARARVAAGAPAAAPAARGERDQARPRAAASATAASRCARRATATACVLTVRDTGAGVTAPDPNAPHDADAAPSRFGLAQVRERLAAVYGAAASLELTPADDAEGGSRAVVTCRLGPCTLRTHDALPQALADGCERAHRRRRTAARDRARARAEARPGRRCASSLAPSTARPRSSARCATGPTCCSSTSACPA